MKLQPDSQASTQHTDTTNSLKTIGFKRQWQIFLVALAFFTRIPIPESTPYSPERLNQANRYFGAVGIIIGLLTALTYWVFVQIFPIELAVAAAIICGLLLTGAFHEDGLADVFDGFGGGWSVEQKLNIMKDSRLGTYGASALVMMLGCRWAVLIGLAKIDILLPAGLLIVMHTLSRICAASLIFSYPYVRADQDSKVKPLANQQSQHDLWVLIATGLIILLLLPLEMAITLTLVLLVVRWLCGKWFQQQLGGYTGDCLGAAQQIAELMGYLTLLAWLS
ncbi:adenosylcobinamide-GDP ribazoletransferase [Photobacterium frigidiphilum]|uniref:Adenosylcobinamide-GDP ribazoletransferase n=1 Tax=Photobacterium frigidiphilum TaxID=264736 RepID=A0A2T3JQU0_9GAMM|nr:adenosylcobinamide-GDP ribazoletransferase [Photobacterium frigidiphilum]PSU51451.1 adenosylcobinamide-GDP ribazoletransferase [Photobacterium frigidiphilum]